MAITNHERVGKAMEWLREGLAPFVERELNDKVKRNAVHMDALRRFEIEKPYREWDAAAFLKLMGENWREVFSDTLGFTERSLVSELREWRNRWAHQERLSSDDTDRALDSAERLLTGVSSPQAAEVATMKLELRRRVFDEQVRGERRRATGSLVEAVSAGGLQPWREVVTPHSDVASGRYQQAEFAADLGQVHQGEGTDEYRDPGEFFRRTFLTESLKRLLAGGTQRLAGKGGDPVVQLQTNFGGGKTHSMLALYHLFSGIPARELTGMDEVLSEAGVEFPREVRRVVLVGTRISPGNPKTKGDGTVVRTLWGELAWQLGGKEAFERVRADDERATSPGDVLRKLLNEYGPCLVLIDEWVSYARQLHDDPDLPAGSFETQFTFAQALTESVKLTGNCLLVISLPASDTSTPDSPHTEADDAEVGGVRGRGALDRLRNVLGRIDSPWRPASAEESFEIVRRRLFEPLAGPDPFTQRDVTARAFSELYRLQQVEFPAECRTADYERRIRTAYPIHPEIFDRLYTDWSALAKFQRTRGVLRLMAAVIHSLWERGDRNPLLLPSTLPIDDDRVRNELTRYLSDNWNPVIDKDVDGPGSLPVAIDGRAPNLGKLSATRRVARTVYLGSAPTTAAAHRGIDDSRVKLGCVMPGESPAVFGDALRRLAAEATYLYQDGPRQWYATQPTVTKLAEDRAEQLGRQPRRGRQGIGGAAEEGPAQHRGLRPHPHPAPLGSGRAGRSRRAAGGALRGASLFAGAGQCGGGRGPGNPGVARQYAEAVPQHPGLPGGGQGAVPGPRRGPAPVPGLGVDPRREGGAQPRPASGQAGGNADEGRRRGGDRAAAGGVPVAVGSRAGKAGCRGLLGSHSADCVRGIGGTGRQAAAQRGTAGSGSRGDHPAQAPRRGALMARGGSRGGAAACRGFRPLFVPATATRPGGPHARRPGRHRPADLGVGFIRPGREPRRGRWTLPRFAGGTGGRSFSRKPGPARKAGCCPPAAGRGGAAHPGTGSRGSGATTWSWSGWD